jgi:hypothetical protein
VVATALLGLGPVTTVCAAEPAREGKIALQVSDCPEAFEASLRSILVIELGGLLDEGRAAATADGESIAIACEVETARIAARSSRGGVVHNDVRFDAFPGDAAPRAVGLAALEALRAVDPTLAERIVAQRSKGAPPERATEPPPPARAEPPAKRHEPDRSPVPSVAPRGFTRVVAGGVARWFLGEPRTLAAGGRLELSRRFASPWDAGFDLDGAFSRRRVELGAVEARLLSTAAWFGARAGGAAWSLTGAVGGRLGLALLSGDPSASTARGHRITRAWGGPTLALRTDGAVGPLALALVLEGGLMAAGAEGLAGGASAIGITTGWASASANLGIRY